MNVSRIFKIVSTQSLSLSLFACVPVTSEKPNWFLHPNIDTALNPINETLDPEMRNKSHIHSCRQLDGIWLILFSIEFNFHGGLKPQYVNGDIKSVVCIIFYYCGYPFSWTWIWSKTFFLRIQRAIVWFLFRIEINGINGKRTCYETINGDLR